jgi:mitochondrial fission protein ELM1
MVKVWVLFDDKIGSNKQSLAIAERLTADVVIKNVKYTKYIKFPNFVRRNSLVGVDIENSDDILHDFPDVAISCGRRLASVLLYIKKHSKKTKIITILNPDLNIKKFDLVVVPEHDCLFGKNVINFVGALVNFDKEKTKNECNKWKETFSKYKKPLVAILLGGDNKDKKFSPIKMKEVLNLILNNDKYSFLITTSRRTSDKCVNVIKELISDKKNVFLYDWKKENGQNNPYTAMLWSADHLIITGDSISMIVEACSTGKPVYIYMPQETLTKKHYLFCSQIVAKKIAQELCFSKLSNYKYKPLNEIENVIEKIKDNLNL